jgi:hypothetical protein
MFTMIFGGEAFMDWYMLAKTLYVANLSCRIGELSLLKNMMDTMEVLGVDPQEEVEAEAKTPPEISTPSSSAGARRAPFQAITAAPDPRSTVAASEKPGKKRKGLTPEQKQKLEIMQIEQEVIRRERVAILSQRLLDKISVWIETDRSDTITEAFKTKIQVFLALT